ncbi:sigma-70 family RNA polymerase sigma factor [Paenibacillus jilunlii]|uniref:RNA polymerase sigma-70 factor, ECF subfamily n=1 Tax=Paenibacillus jilunlii TaxID=682956 RepID=A0A1G9H8N8_9BACL|nr:sigma-70 family RNA polymerase sigma factor [Paenibacillus jilunlii]KWX77437.1 RNA polymerase subunit sigma [Paenibacillus jilunlii]SDL09215.1 RNA polymerase sigma-70 factor, ECF subfamily [Paenibacillus jilunlii]
MVSPNAEMKKLTGAVTREDDSFYDAVMEHSDQLYRIAYSYLRNRSDALEAVQETTCRAWIKRATLKDPRAFKSWIIRILIYVCIDEQRRRKRTVPTPEEAMREPVMQDSSSKLEMLWAVEQVKPKYRHVLLLKYYNDMTLTEIADLLGKPEGTIKTWQHKGLKQLRTIMKNRGEWNDQ